MFGFGLYALTRGVVLYPNPATGWSGIEDGIAITDSSDHQELSFTLRIAKST